MLDFVGQRFGRLVALRRVPGGSWMCQCDCGKISYALTGNLKSGNSTSCGCSWREKITTHGATNTPEYMNWKAMHTRCRSNLPRIKPHYKDRGITVSEEWGNFVTFLKDMGLRPTPDSEVDRINNDLGYSKENCRWASSKENLNNRRGNRVVEYEGKKQTIAEWADELGMNYRTLNNRINRGWPIERALSQAVQET